MNGVHYFMKSLKSQNEVEIDGSVGEGGGSILRVAAGICTFAGKGLKITNIRKNRTPPGLKLQHLLGISSLKEITDGILEGATIGSTELYFKPGSKWISNYSIKIDTAGSIGLLTQSLQYALLGAPPGDYTFQIEGGGTYGKGAPDPYLLNNTTFKLFRKIGYDVQIKVEKEGFYPRGGAKGKIVIKVPPKIQGFDFTTKGAIKAVGTRICVSNQLKNKRVGERIEKVIRRETADLKINDIHSIDCDYVDTLSPGVGLSGYIEYDNGAVKGSGLILGELKLSSEELAKEYCSSLINCYNHPSAVDVWTADQLIPLMPMCEGQSCFNVEEITSHAKTNMEIVEKLFECKYTIEKVANGWKISL